MKAIKIASALSLSLVAICSALMFMFFVPLSEFDDLVDEVKKYPKEPHY